MIAFIDNGPSIEAHNGGFLLTFKSGDTETQFFLTLYAMTDLCGRGMVNVRDAQTKAASSVPTTFRRERH